MIPKSAIFLLWICAFLFIRSEAEAEVETSIPLVKSLMAKIDCTCGCGMTLEVCEKDDPTCTTRPEIVSRIEQLLQQGMTEEEIIKGLKTGITPAEKAMCQAREENKYLFLFFYEKGSKDSQRMREVIKKAKKKWGKKANFIEVDINDIEEREGVVRRFGIYSAPVTLVMAPNGVIVGGFPGVVGLDRLERAFVSSKMAEVIQGLQRRKVIFLCILNEQMEGAQGVLKVVNEVAEILGKSVRVVKLDSADKREEKLLNQLGIAPNIDSPIIIVISQTGEISDRFTGRVTNRDLLTAFQKVLVSRSRCGGMGSGPGGGTCE